MQSLERNDLAVLGPLAGFLAHAAKARRLFFSVLPLQSEKFSVTFDHTGEHLPRHGAETIGTFPPGEEEKRSRAFCHRRD